MKCHAQSDHQRSEVSRIERLALIDHASEWIFVYNDLLLPDKLRFVYVMEGLIPAEEILLER